MVPESTKRVLSRDVKGLYVRTKPVYSSSESQRRTPVSETSV